MTGENPHIVATAQPTVPGELWTTRTFGVCSPSVGSAIPGSPESGLGTSRPLAHNAGSNRISLHSTPVKRADSAPERQEAG